MSELPGQILLQCILIALNAFFAASEIAVISLNSNKLRAQAEDAFSAIRIHCRSICPGSSDMMFVCLSVCDMSDRSCRKNATRQNLMRHQALSLLYHAAGEKGAGNRGSGHIVTSGVCVCVHFSHSLSIAHITYRKANKHHV